tara:strand:+ start:5909 stop:6331 length:423 start_codon:yes stop_codon:yes gene_type:complete
MVPKGFWSLMVFCAIMPFIIVATWPVWVFFGIVKDTPKPKKKIVIEPLPIYPQVSLKRRKRKLKLQYASSIVAESESTKSISNTPPKVTTKQTIIDDAISALMSVGFKKTEAKNAVCKACSGKAFDNVEDVIKATMKKSN